MQKPVTLGMTGALIVVNTYRLAGAWMLSTAFPAPNVHLRLKIGISGRKAGTIPRRGGILEV